MVSTVATRFALVLATLSLSSTASSDDAASFFRGLNFNGPAVLIDGNRWEGKDSENYECKDKAFEQQGVALVPATDPQRAQMIRSSRWNGNRVLLKNLPNETFTVFLYVWEDNRGETFDISLDGKTVVAQFSSGAAGHWQRLGPWYVDVTKGTIELTSRGGAANFSGVELWRGKHDGSQDVPISEDQLTFFENRIRPLLVKHCYECHSSESDDLQGGLLVDSRPTLRRGGTNGPTVVPGDVDHSLLIQAVRYADGMEMPPDEKLSAAEVADLERWVAMGAPDPRATATRFVRKKIDVEKARQFWSLRPLADPPVPSPADADWPVTEIDRFIAAKLDSSGLVPTGDADKRTLIRRATFDLTGLPPSPQEIEAFVADDSAEAFAKVVDRLLKSPRYGERWGRHWMDLVRYADTAGDNSDFPIPEAYLYRNYIIDSFNADKPYDRFIQEQIAGDLMPAESEAEKNEQTIATGYLASSRRFGSVIKNYPQHLTIEDTIDNLGRTVLGMTVACARCHDHKFDPISQDDYYGLYGIFASTRYPFPGIELDQKPRDFVALVDGGKPGKELAYAMADGNPRDVPLQQRGEPDQPGDVIPRKFLEVLGGQMLPEQATQSSGRLQLAQWMTAADNPLAARVMANRIWQYHFGSGLVKTPSDFGIRGMAPSHPELLDWLASRFIEEGWSIKSLHRRIMLSRTYRLNSQADGNTKALAVDPNNELHWRFDRQRMDAETLRDTMLLLSGELDLQMPREPHPFPPAEKWKYTQHHPFRDSYDSQKRSVYLMMARLNARPFFTTFDGPDQNASTASRDSSVTTVQSLYLINDPFVHEQAEKFAARLIAERKEPDERLTYAFELAFGRPPSASERAGVAEWLRSLDGQLDDSVGDAAKREQAAWTALARSLFRTNEFLYVD
ncbi:PSD1 and planctomycete cytochrome C domain-containing protein [Rosistilla oblonga]|uniref:PSD1 and planctomycete cytochrome C domain-containing protein n=1 Tax=Rosistilla oblonga TaxID=2527990 RepID=UPI003A981CFE